MDLGLTGKVVIVTGASAGIGFATAEQLVGEGAKVVGVSRKPPTRGLGPDFDSFAADLGEPGSVQGPVDFTLAKHGRIDGLVNNVGGVRAHDGFTDMTEDDWQYSMNLNFHVGRRMSSAALPALLAGDGGSIVHITSEAARYPRIGETGYAAAKAATLILSKALAAEFGPRGLRSTVVSPGPTRTRVIEEPGGLADQAADLLGMDRESAIQHFVTHIRPLMTGRIGQPEDVAGVVTYLLSPMAKQVTGAEWAVDGGSLPQI